MGDNQKMLLVDALDPDTERRWVDYWRPHKHASWRQHPAHGRIRAALGDRTVYALGLLDEKIAFAGCFSYSPAWLGIGTAEAVCLRGPVFDDVQFAEWCLPQINGYFRPRGVGLVRIGPYWRFPEAEVLERSLFKHGYSPLERWYPLGRRMTGCVDICNSNDEMLKRFTQSTRWQIKKAGKLGIDYRTAKSSAEASEFFSQLEKRDKERGIAVMSRKEFDAIFSALTNCNEIGTIINAYHNGTFLAGLFVVRGGKTAFTSKFVVSENSKRLFPTLRIAASMFYQGMLWAKSQGCEVVDLEGCSANDGDSNDLTFVNRYKAGFCPSACQTLGQYYYVCNRSMYRVQRLFSFVQWASVLPRRLAYRVQFALKKRRVDRHEGRE